MQNIPSGDGVKTKMLWVAIEEAKRGHTMPKQQGTSTAHAVIYARVSSKEQEKEGFSIPAQLKLLRQYAMAQGFPVIQEYVDVETAKRAGRTGFTEMVGFFKKQMIRKGKHGYTSSPFGREDG